MTEILFSNEICPSVELPVHAYPDGMPLIYFTEANQRIDRVLLRPKSMASFVAAMFWFDARAARGHAPPELILPCVPGARQDRLNSSGDYLFTVHSVAKMINDRHFPSVTVLDPHSEVTPALIDRCKVIHAADLIHPPLGKYAAIASPDAGAEKRAAAVAKRLRLPLLHAWKTRDVNDGKITGFGMELAQLPPGSLVLVVDDLCDGGGTFIGLADVLDAAGLKAHLWVTHGLFTKGTSELRQRYAGHVYCSDSVIADRPSVFVQPICEKLLTQGTL
jgi:ribose-phosphate pyrophosphokinase